MVNNIIIFAVALLIVIKSATMATKYAGKLAENFHVSKYTVGFLIIAVISILPETFIAINASLEGIPSFGLGMLFGSNIADLTLVFAIIIILAGRGLKVENKILKNHAEYPFLLLWPLILGFDGYFSRLEGAALIFGGGIFYYIAFKNGVNGALATKNGNGKLKSFFMLLLSMVGLLAGAHFTVTSTSVLADLIGISPIFIGMLIVGLGTTMPELLFALKSVQKRDDALAIGDILGTVLADATIVVGILALINPFSFPQKIIYITGMFMVVASFILFRLMRSGKILTKKEAYMLIIFWIIFVITEFLGTAAPLSK